MILVHFSNSTVFLQIVVFNFILLILLLELLDLFIILGDLYLVMDVKREPLTTRQVTVQFACLIAVNILCFAMTKYHNKILITRTVRYHLKYLLTVRTLWLAT